MIAIREELFMVIKKAPLAAGCSSCKAFAKTFAAAAFVILAACSGKDGKPSAGAAGEAPAQTGQASEAASEADTEAILEAPRALVSFESSYLAAVAERGEVKSADDLLFRSPAGSGWFKYEFIAGADGGIAGYRAAALSDIWSFTAGSFIETVFTGHEFRRCAGGKDADRAGVIGAAGALIRDFFHDSGVAWCGDAAPQGG
jgi:hypothetical protein